MTVVEQQPSPQELFKRIAERMSAMGVPVAQLLNVAEAEQRNGDDGAFVVLEPDEYGPGAIVAVKSDVVDVKVGGTQFALDIEEVRDEYLPGPQDTPPTEPQA